MHMLNFLIDAAVVAAVYLFPIIVLLLFVAPLIITKLRRKKFTVLNVIVSLLIGAALAASAIFVAYWSVALLQGLAFLDYHGFN